MDRRIPSLASLPYYTPQVKAVSVFALILRAPAANLTIPAKGGWDTLTVPHVPGQRVDLIRACCPCIFLVLSL